jgi:hypothetical protein
MHTRYSGLFALSSHTPNGATRISQREECCRSGTSVMEDDLHRRAYVVNALSQDKEAPNSLRHNSSQIFHLEGCSMRIPQSLIAFLLCAVAGSAKAAPIVFSSVTCGVSGLPGQSVSSNSYAVCNLSNDVTYEIGGNSYQTQISARASARSGFVSVYNNAAETRPMGGYTAGSTATFDSYEKILTEGPVRDGLVRLGIEVSAGGCDGLFWAGAEFGPYGFVAGRGCGNDGSGTGTVPYAITLGIPLSIHQQASASASTNFWESIENQGWARVSVQYSFYEADGVTPVDYTSLELPEPSAFAPVAALLGFGIYVIRRRSWQK